MTQSVKVTSYKTQPLEDTLANFIIRYRPPYVVQVLEGVESPTGACSLSLDEIITIHTVVRLKRIKIKNSKGKYFFSACRQLGQGRDSSQNTHAAEQR